MAAIITFPFVFAYRLVTVTGIALIVGFIFLSHYLFAVCDHSFHAKK